MNLSNSFKDVKRYLIIRGMYGLGSRNKVLIVSALVCMVTHWTRLMVIHDVRLLGIHEFTKLLYCIISNLREY